MELAHVDLDERIVVTEEELGESLGQLRLTHTGRTSEDEGTGRTVRILEACTRASNSPRDCLDCVLLADDALVQLVLHVDEPGRFLLGELEHGDAGPVGQHLGDLLLAYLGDFLQLTGAPLLFLLGPLLGELALVIAEPCGLFKVLSVDGGFLLAAHLGNPLVDLAQALRRRHPLDAHAGTSLIDEVNGLIREETVVDVAIRQAGGGSECTVGDGHAVVRLVAVAQALQDLDGVLDGRLRHVDWLETTLECGILFDVLAVLIQRGRADGLQLTAGELRLQQRSSVDRALGGTRTNNGVDLIDEQADVTTLVDLLEHLLQALLKITTVTGTRNEGTEVQRVQLLITQRLRNTAVDDVERQALNDGGLAHARLADEHRVVLRAARQHLHDALDFLLTPHNRIQLAVLGQLREVSAELIQRQRVGALTGAAHLATTERATTRGSTRTRESITLWCLATLLALVAGQKLNHRLAHTRQIRAELHQHTCSNAFTLANEAEEQELGADVLVPHLEAFAQGQLEHLLGARRKRNMPARRLRAGADELLYFLAHILKRNTHGFEGLGGHAFALVDEAEQDVLGADVIVVEHPRFFLREHNDSAGAVRKPFEHLCFPFACTTTFI